MNKRLRQLIQRKLNGLQSYTVYHTARRLLEDARRYGAAITRYLAKMEEKGD